MAITQNSKQALEQFISTQLNDQQRAAVLHEQGPILVVAGAGSGKTRVITARIAHLLAHHEVPAANIVALTFTNKAAREMKERIAKFLATEDVMPFIGTFHAYCVRLLKQYHARMALPQFSIIDADDQKELINAIIKGAGLEKRVNAKTALYAISMAKNQALELLSSTSGMYVPAVLTQDPILRDIYVEYERRKQLSNYLDFDDLLIKMLQYLHTDKMFASYLRATIQHVLVDEYQDTNAVQHALLKILTQDGSTTTARSICAVGDEDQSIYSWRGATVANMSHFVRDFTGTKIITIEQNYRSVQPILSVANNIIKNNDNRNEKKLWSARQANNRVIRVTCASGYQEGTVVAAAASNSKQQPVAVLYRTHFQSRVLEEVLLRSKIPYTIIGGIQFYERKEIKDILAYLRLICNPRDRISFSRIVNVPKRKLGSATVEAIVQAWDNVPFGTFQEAIQLAGTQGLVAGSKLVALNEFCQLLSTFTPNDAPSTTITKLVTTTGYITYLRDEYDTVEAEEKIQNVQELLRAASYYELNDISTIQQMLDEIALMQELMHEKPAEQPRVQLMTIHAAKGLEFPTVIVTGLEEGMLPSSRSLEDEEAVQEERRLLYVAITRAQERLILCHAGLRNTYGTTVMQDPSRFVNELPTNEVRTLDVANMRDYQVQELMTAFMTDKLPARSAPAPTKFTFPDELPFKPVTDEPIKPATTSSYKKFQSVQHPIFGLGIIQDVQERSDGSAILTIRFSRGLKTIDSSFVQ